MEDIQFPPIHSAGPGSPFLLLTPPTTHFHSFYLTLRTSIAAIFFVACLRQVLEAVMYILTSEKEKYLII